MFDMSNDLVYEWHQLYCTEVAAVGIFVVDEKSCLHVVEANDHGLAKRKKSQGLGQLKLVNFQNDARRLIANLVLETQSTSCCV